MYMCIEKTIWWEHYRALKMGNLPSTEVIVPSFKKTKLNSQIKDCLVHYEHWKNSSEEQAACQHSSRCKFIPYCQNSVRPKTDLLTDKHFKGN